MGITQSSPLKSRPDEFATRVGSKDDAKWRAYDYVVVGGGSVSGLSKYDVALTGLVRQVLLDVFWQLGFHKIWIRLYFS